MLLAELFKDVKDRKPIKFGAGPAKAQAERIRDMIKRMEEKPSLTPAQQASLKFLKIELKRLSFTGITEGFFDSWYVVKEKSDNSWEVAKFKGGKTPEKVGSVRRKGKTAFEAPGYSRNQQDTRSIEIVKQWLKDGRKPGLAYKVEDDGKIVSRNILEGAGAAE